MHTNVGNTLQLHTTHPKTHVSQIPQQITKKCYKLRRRQEKCFQRTPVLLQFVIHEVNEVGWMLAHFSV